jgi:hypothetical protein
MPEPIGEEWRDRDPSLAVPRMTGYLRDPLQWPSPGFKRRLPKRDAAPAGENRSGGSWPLGVASPQARPLQARSPGISPVGQMGRSAGRSTIQTSFDGLERRIHGPRGLRHRRTHSQRHRQGCTGGSSAYAQPNFRSDLAELSVRMPLGGSGMGCGMVEQGGPGRAPPQGVKIQIEAKGQLTQAIPLGPWCFSAEVRFPIRGIAVPFISTRPSTTG